MIESPKAWFPLPNIDIPFGSISYSYHRGGRLSVSMHGERTLTLHFSKVVAVRFELECPGFESFPHPLPRFDDRYTYPLLKIENSQLSEQYSLIYGERSHFWLISSDDLIHVVASPDVKAEWVE